MGWADPLTHESNSGGLVSYFIDPMYSWADPTNQPINITVSDGVGWTDGHI